MPQFEIDVVRTATSMQTITVTASTRQEAQDKALDEAGDHLYKELCATYELDSNNGRNTDELSDLQGSQLVLGCSCSNEHIAHPSYLIVQVTPQLVRTIKDGMDLCQQKGLLKVILAIPSPTTWASVNDDDSSGSVMGLGQMTITKADFCISAGMRHSDAIVESVDVTFDDLMQHILAKTPETVLSYGQDDDVQDLRELLAEDRENAAQKLSGADGDQPQS